MSTHPSPLLAEIERDLLDGRPVEDVLRKLIILGGRSGSSELMDWASQELRGYAEKNLEDLPNYRKLAAMIQLDASVAGGTIKHQTIAPHELPEEARGRITNEVPFWQGIGEIQALIKNHAAEKTVRIALPGERLLARMIDENSKDPFQHIDAMYWSVSTTALEGLVDQVRTRLAELLGELRAATPANADAPSAAIAANAVNVVVNGKGNRVNVAHAAGVGAAGAGAPTESDGPFWTLGKKIGALVVGAATVAAAVFGYLQLNGGA